MYHNMHKRTLFSIAFLCFFGCGFYVTSAFEVIDYGSDPVVDGDLDGLTDKGELQLYKTDPKDPDSDDDGFLDGVEVIHEADPLDNKDPLLKKFHETVPDMSTERAPLSWYMSRATGMVAYALLWLVIFFGLAFRNPLLKKFIAPIYKLDMHVHLSLLTFVFVISHGTVLMFDTFMHFSLVDVFVPFAADPDMINTPAVAWGIIGLYILFILIVTSLLRARLPQKMWRWLHFLHVALFGLIVAHVLMIGTDFQAGLSRNIFLVSVVILTFLYIVSLGEVIMRLFKKRQNSASDTQNSEQL